MYGFDKKRIVTSVVRVFNADFNMIGQLGRYFKAEDIEDIEVWYIGIRVKFCKDIVPKRRFTMVSKAKVCAKSAPYAREEVTFDRDGIQGDRIHIITYTLKNDPSGEQHQWTTSMGFDERRSAQLMKDWLWQTNSCAHSVIRPGKRTGYKWELKIWELHPDILEDYMSPNRRQKKELIEVIKPNGAYRFMQGQKMILAVYTKPELNHEIEKFLKLGHEVIAHDPSGRKAYNCKLVDGEVKFTLISKVRAIA